MKILITGGSGFIGKHLIPILQNQNFNVSVLSRNRQGSISSYIWDVDKKNIDPAALSETDSIIHLAGAGISNKRWSKEYKREIIDSRVRSAQLLFDTLSNNPGHRVKTIISASAIGYYGDTGDTWVEEEFKSKSDFLGEVCREWEKSVLKFESIGLRVVILRIGIILAKDGGALPQLAMPIRLFAGAPLGRGDQYLSWIHVDDLCRIFAFALTNDKMHGIYNAVAPRPVTNKAFTKEIALILKRPVWPINVPSFVLKIILGEKAILPLYGQRVSSEKIRMAGFEFRHTDLKKALVELL